MSYVYSRKQVLSASNEWTDRGIRVHIRVFRALDVHNDKRLLAIQSGLPRNQICASRYVQN